MVSGGRSRLGLAVRADPFHLSPRTLPDLRVPRRGFEGVSVFVEDSGQAADEERRVYCANPGCLGKQRSIATNSPAEGGLCLMENAAPDAPPEVARVSSEWDKNVMGIEEGAERVLALAALSCVGPSATERELRS